VKVIKSNKKILYVNRGLPGSGKSTLAKELAGTNGVIFSTDDFFINPKSGQYEFDPKLLYRNHFLNLQRTIKAMQDGITPIVVDNTNVEFFQMKPYVKEAQKNGYEVIFSEPQTTWAWDVDELTKRNTHNVPKTSIERMLSRYQKDPTVEKILESKAPWEKDE